MKAKPFVCFVFLLILSSLALADMLISFPKIDGYETGNIERGATPRIVVRYRNATADNIYLTSAGFHLVFNSNTIDNIISITNSNPRNMQEIDRSVSVNLPPADSEIIYKLASIGDPPAIRPGETKDLAVIAFHVSQIKQLQLQKLLLLKGVALFNWSALGPNEAYYKQINVTGQLFTQPLVYLKDSGPPLVPSWLSVKLGSENQLHKKDIGNTLLLDWVSVGSLNWASTGNTAIEFTPYFNRRMHFRLYRNTVDSFDQGSGAMELTGAEPAHDSYSDPADRVPWTGNLQNEPYKYQNGPGTGVPDLDSISDGVPYYYRLAVVDDTSPDPNYINSVTFSQVPMDLAPPGEVTGLTATPNNDNNVPKIVLNWQNPTDPDLGGVIILRTIGSGKPVGSGNLGSAQPLFPYNDGPDYSGSIGTEPFGAGNGTILYVSPMAYDPASVDMQYADDNSGSGLINGEVYNYKIFTYDRALAGPPREMGRNYSTKGSAKSCAAGIPPKPVADFTVTEGSVPGEVNFNWTNSDDNYGTLIKYSTAGFSDLKDQNAGEVMGVFPVTSGPGMQEMYTMNLTPGAKYYFKAWAFNQTDQDLDPSDPVNMAKHLFSSGQTAAINYITGKTMTYVYNFKKKINYFAIPFPGQSLTDANDKIVDISTMARLVDAINAQADGNVLVSLGRWNADKQQAEGIYAIDYNKTGNARFTCTPGFSSDDPIIQGEALVASVSTQFTFTLKSLISQ
ncbi:MAG: hypothetical protein WC624_01885 [Candidatus Margulisiibacteriota bacterium]